MFEGASGLSSGDLTVGAYQPRFLMSEDGSIITAPVAELAQEAGLDWQKAMKEMLNGLEQESRQTMDSLKGSAREAYNVLIKNAQTAVTNKDRERWTDMARRLAKRSGIDPEENNE